MDLKDLYRDVIVDHNRNPRNFRPMPEADRHAEGFNPLCGDRLTLYVKLDGDLIADVSFQGSGCAISVASASLLTESVKGRRRRGRAAVRTMHELLTSPTPRSTGPGKARRASGVRTSSRRGSSARASAGTRSMRRCIRRPSLYAPRATRRSGHESLRQRALYAVA
jgi:nitrogen fixation NifU-like protein